MFNNNPHSQPTETSPLLSISLPTSVESSDAWRLPNTEKLPYNGVANILPSFYLVWILIQDNTSLFSQSIHVLLLLWSSSCDVG